MLGHVIKLTVQFCGITGLLLHASKQSCEKNQVSSRGHREVVKERTCDCELARTYLHGLNLHQKERFDVLSLSYLFSFFFSLFFFFITKERESTLQLCLSHFFLLLFFFISLSFFLSRKKVSRSWLRVSACWTQIDGMGVC